MSLLPSTSTLYVISTLQKNTVIVTKLCDKKIFVTNLWHFGDDRWLSLLCHKGVAVLSQHYDVLSSNPFLSQLVT